MLSPGGWVTSTLDTEATSTCLSAVTTDTTTTSAPSSPRSSPFVVSGTCSSTREDASTSPPPASERHLLTTRCRCSHASPLRFLFLQTAPVSKPFLNFHHHRSIPEERQNKSKNTRDKLKWLFMVLKINMLWKTSTPPGWITFILPANLSYLDQGWL